MRESQIDGHSGATLIDLLISWPPAKSTVSWPEDNYLPRSFATGPSTPLGNCSFAS